MEWLQRTARNVEWAIEKGKVADWVAEQRRRKCAELSHFEDEMKKVAHDLGVKRSTLQGVHGVPSQQEDAPDLHADAAPDEERAPQGPPLFEVFVARRPRRRSRRT